MALKMSVGNTLKGDLGAFVVVDRNDCLRKADSVAMKGFELTR